MNFHLNTVSKTLWDSLILLMNLEAFNDFRLVGGTSLSLQLGHRESCVKMEFVLLKVIYLLNRVFVSLM